MNGFQWAAGSVMGTYHRRTEKNNQDAFCIDNSPGRFVAVVADGCGSGERNEVGATLGVRALVNDLRAWPLYDLWPVLDVHRRRMAARFEELLAMAGASGSAVGDFISNHCLYTIVGAVMDENELVMFSFGDGAVGYNGEVDEWDYPSNAPPYLAYDLVIPDNNFDWHCLHRGPTSEIENFMIGTDGVGHLIEAANAPMPSKSFETVAPVKEMWADDSLFSNRDGLRRYLSLVNKDAVRLNADGDIEKHPGLLSDDTTMVLVRREPS